MTIEKVENGTRPDVDDGVVSEERIQVDDLVLVVSNKDAGGLQYKRHRWVNEYRSSFYDVVSSSIEPTYYFDVGANYGLTALMARRRFPDAIIVCVEPDERLCGYVSRNFKENGLAPPEIVRAIVTDEPSNKIEFRLNPRGSTDNRVIAPNTAWPRAYTRGLTLSSLCKDVAPEEGCLIKVDTQGWDYHVLRSGEDFLTNHPNWIVKIEFAPHWLASQKTSAEDFLIYAAERFQVFEFPAHSPWGINQLDQVAIRRLTPRDAEAFCNYVANLDVKEMGYGDLLILPKGLRKSEGYYSLRRKLIGIGKGLVKKLA
jgi:FkbM family methyltransferase